MTMKYANLDLGTIEAVFNKLGGMEGAQRFLRGELIVSTAVPTEYPVWKTVKLGLHKSPDDYRAAIKSAKQKIGSWGDDILGRITCSQEETDVDLVVLSVGDLGFKDGARYADICAKAVELGLELCPAEVGPALRLQYDDQPRGEWVLIAMEAITDRYGYRSIFNVAHGGGELWLSGHGGCPGCFWSAEYRFAFVRRK